MAQIGNHVGHYDEPNASPRREKKRRPANIADNSDETVIYSTEGSLRAPSIDRLENLRMCNSNYLTIDKGDDNDYSDHIQGKTQSKQFFPSKHGQGVRKKTKVYVTVVVLKIGEIETIKEYFESDVYIQARWREPLLDNSRTTVTDFSQYWNPELVVQNVFEDPKTRMWQEVRYTPRGDAYIYEMRRVKGKFFETMELNDFPFDIQAISIVLTSEFTKDVVEIIEDDDDVSLIHHDCFSDSQEWTLHKFVEVSPFDISSQYTRASRNYSGVIATCCVSRRYGFFAWNVLAIQNLLTIFAFTTFAVDHALVQNRLQLSFILLLAGISFRFVSNHGIPKISYLTHLDRYMLISTMFSGGIALWHALLSRVTSEEVQDRMDFWAFVVFAAAYFLFQLIFIIIMLYQRKYKLDELRGKESKFEMKAISKSGNFIGVLHDRFSNVSSNLTLRKRSNIHMRPR